MVGFQDWVGLSFLGPAIVSAAARSGNLSGTGVDFLNCSKGQAAVILTGTATATAVISVEESDDNSTNWTAVPTIASALSVNNQVPLNVPISATETIYAGNFVRSKRYVRCTVTGTGWTLAGIFIGRLDYTGS